MGLAHLYAGTCLPEGTVPCRDLQSDIAYTKTLRDRVFPSSSHEVPGPSLLAALGFEQYQNHLRRGQSLASLRFLEPLAGQQPSVT